MRIKKIYERYEVTNTGRIFSKIFKIKLAI